MTLNGYLQRSELWSGHANLGAKISGQLVQRPCGGHRRGVSENQDEG